MTDLADRTIHALRAEHDRLAEHVAVLTDDQLGAPSGASEWSVAQVLSHLGSGAEIGLVPVRAAVAGGPVPDRDNQVVWDRWNAMSPEEQAREFVPSEELLVEAYEALTPDQRTGLEVDLGFLPQPLPVGTVAGMRLNEAAHHAWDVRVAVDQAAQLDATTAGLLAEHLAGGLGFLLGFTAKPDQVSEPTTLAVGDYALVIDDGVQLTTDSAEPTAHFRGPLEALLRLLAGRLRPEHTPADVDVRGNVTMAALRRVFPGY